MKVLVLIFVNYGINIVLYFDFCNFAFSLKLRRAFVRFTQFIRFVIMNEPVVVIN